MLKQREEKLRARDTELKQREAVLRRSLASSIANMNQAVSVPFSEVSPICEPRVTKPIKIKYFLEQDQELLNSVLLGSYQASPAKLIPDILPAGSSTLVNTAADSTLDPRLDDAIHVTAFNEEKSDTDSMLVSEDANKMLEENERDLSSLNILI
jgi:hypothetical protein